jgi:hypothetical protein
MLRAGIEIARRKDSDSSEYGPVATLMIFASAGDRDEHSLEESLSAGRVLWFAKGTHRGFVNVGTERYRQIAVELK